ncbi:MAG: hypothetical protein U5L11_14045 [Arhodomonas sp.]|nr:hypothetical protein [Arhodomonas sp.]
MRYLEWLGGVLTGDWGRSLTLDTAVLPLALERLGRSLLLAGYALALLVPVAIAAGVRAGQAPAALRSCRLGWWGWPSALCPNSSPGCSLSSAWGWAWAGCRCRPCPTRGRACWNGSATC